MNSIIQELEEKKNWKLNIHEFPCTICGKTSSGYLVTIRGLPACRVCASVELAKQGFGIIRDLDHYKGLTKLFSQKQPVVLRYGLVQNLNYISHISPHDSPGLFEAILLQLGEVSSHPTIGLLRYQSMRILFEDLHRTRSALGKVVRGLDEDSSVFNRELFVHYAAPLILWCAPDKPRLQRLVKKSFDADTTGYYGALMREVGGFLIARYESSLITIWLKKSIIYLEYPRSELEILRDAIAEYAAEIIDTTYLSPEVKKFFSSYIKPVQDKIDPYLPPLLRGYRRQLKDDLCWIIGYVFTEPAIFKLVSSLFSPALRALLSDLVFNGEVCRVDELALTPSGPPKSGEYQRKEYVLRYFPFLRYQHSYSSWNSVHDFCYLPAPIAGLLRYGMASPTFTTLQGAEAAAPGVLVEGVETFMQSFNFLQDYITTVGVNYSKNGKGILKSSLKELKNVGAVPEPYADSKYLPYLRVELILRFLDIVSPKYQEGLPLIEELYKKICSPFYPQAVDLAGLLTHLREPDEKSDCSSGQRSPSLGLGICLRQMRADRWYHLDELVEVLGRNDLLGRPYHKQMTRRLLQSRSPGRLHDIQQGNRIIVDTNNYHDLVELPYLKMLLMLLNTIGLLDITCREPEGDYHLQNRVYLTGYDGITGCRLTALGMKVLGLTDEYEASSVSSDALALLDEQLLLVTLKGADPLRSVYLEKVAQKIGNTLYSVDEKSFTKGCSSEKDLASKIEGFRSLFASRPLPDCWESFFAQLKGKNELVQVEAKQYVSFIMSEDQRGLLEFLRTDERLSEQVIFAQGNRFFVPVPWYTTVRKVLKEQGYLIPELRDALSFIFADELK